MDYVRGMAEEMYAEHGKTYALAGQGVHDSKWEEADGELELDKLITRAKDTLGQEGFEHIHRIGLNKILADIRSDLEAFGVHYESWFSERSLTEARLIEACIAQMEKSGDIYHKDGAKWFQSTAYGDEKDRVVIRDNGNYTYFAADIAYHKNKFDRGFDKMINIWGADHHGYIKRVRASLEALGERSEKLEIRLVQFATLYRGREKLQMSTRTGEFVTLRALRDEVGEDAARFFYVMRRPEQHLDFDLELAKSRSNENPLYYIQYTHARICNVYAKLTEKGYRYDEDKRIAATTPAG